jgi:hypothetical protein
VAICALSVFYIPLQQRKTDRTHGVLTDIFFGLGLWDLPFCKGDPSHFYKNESHRNRTDGVKAEAVGALLLYVCLNINANITTKIGPHARILTDVLLGLGLEDLHFCKGDLSCLYKIESVMKSDERCRISGCRRLVCVLRTFTITKNGSHARSSHGRFTWVRAKRLTFL